MLRNLQEQDQKRQFYQVKQRLKGKQVESSHQIIKSSNNQIQSSQEEMSTTISLESLNNLYCKYLTEYILQYLPREIMNEVNVLLNMRSAIDVHKYLDSKLKCSQNVDVSNQSIERKSKESKNVSTGNIEIANNSSIDRRAYLQDDKDRTQTRKMNSLLKRANTLFQKPQDREKALSHVTLMGDQKQQKNNQLSSQGSVKKVHSQTQSTSHISMPLYRQEIDTLSENRLYQTPDYNKQRKKEQEKVIVDKSNNSFGFKLKQQGQGNFHKEKNNNNNTGSQSGSMGKIEFAKTYSTKQAQDNNSFLGKNNTANRSKLLALVKQTREIFADNAKKILRYENLSSDLATIHNNNKVSEKSCEDEYKVVGVATNGYSNGSYGFNLIGKKY